MLAQLLVIATIIGAIGAIIEIVRTVVFGKKKHIKRKAQKITQTVIKEGTIPGIITLDHVPHGYNPKNINTKLSEEQFFLAFPSVIEGVSVQEEDIKNYATKKQDIIFNNHTLVSLGEEMGIDNFPELVEKNRELVARSFIDYPDSIWKLYNREKYGVRKITFSRDVKNSAEGNMLTILFYETDYFTHQVMRSVYHELKREYMIIEEKNYPFINDDSDVDCLNNYYPFLTSFGVNSLLIRQDDSLEDKVVLLQRSKRLPNMHENQWHVSMNEGLNIDDCVANVINLQNCVTRGYLEELGISNAINNQFYNVFMSLDDFEIGIASTAKVKMSYEEFINALETMAKDRGLETTGSPYELNDWPTDINKWVKTHKDNMTKACRYCLTIYASRNAMS